jgi:predicted amidohydrolase YtcJ
MNLDAHADLILHGGKLTALAPANPVANALAIKEDEGSDGK